MCNQRTVNSARMMFFSFFFPFFQVELHEIQGYAIDALTFYEHYPMLCVEGFKVVGSLYTNSCFMVLNFVEYTYIEPLLKKKMKK